MYTFMIGIFTILCTDLVAHFLVFVFVWIVSLWFHKREESKINKALDDIRDEE